ncbi:MAG: gliding motility-associated C-terminal domain-containing protein [Flavobacteriales bacterium]
MMNLQDTWTPMARTGVLTVLCVLASLTTRATHLVGGEMYYDHLGGDDYEVHLIIYRDCGPTNTNGTGFDLSATLGVYEGQSLFATGTMDLDFNQVTNIDLLSGNPCAVLPPGVCIERAEYVSTLTLPASDQTYTLVYQRCCRNPQVINLQDAMNTGFTMFAEVPPVNSAPEIDTESNSSARFAELPQAYVCQGQPFSLDHLAIDPDGDSLLFAIGDVFIGGTFTAPTPNPPTPPPFTNVTWATGYGPFAPLGLGDEDIMSIDPATGTLTATPTTVGKYVVGIIVTEFRQDDNGNWIPLGKVIRDFTIDVVPCEVLLPEVLWPDPCSGLDLSFDVDADEGAFSWNFGTGLAEDTSSAQAPSHSFTEPGIYPVSLVYDLGGCADSLSIDLAVSPPFSADFALGPITCTADAWSQPVTFAGDDPGTGTLVWTVDGAQVGEGLDPDAFIIPPGNHDVATALTNEFGCVSGEEQPTAYPELPEAAFAMSEPPCNGLDIEFTNLSADADDFAWVFDVAAPWTGGVEESAQPNPTWTYDGFGTFVAQLIAQPGEACADTLLQEVAVLPQDPLVMAFGAIEPLACSLETDVDFFFYGDYADAVTWDFGAAGSASGDTVQYDFGESGLYPVTLTIENDTCGTVQTAEFEVYVPELVAEVELVIPNVLTPNADGKNDRFRVGTRRLDGSVDLANASSFAQFKLQVYDRWGVIVHESEGVGAGWDGRIGGSPAAPGTYYYILEADHSCLDEDLLEVGEVTLIVD